MQLPGSSHITAMRPSLLVVPVITVPSGALARKARRHHAVVELDAPAATDFGRHHQLHIEPAQPQPHHAASFASQRVFAHT